MQESTMGEEEAETPPRHWLEAYKLDCLVS